MKIIIVVDVQNDFTYGALGSPEATHAIGNIMERLMQASTDDIVIFTRDTHDENYMNTQEGRYLPVPHCIKGTKGWEVVDCVDCCVLAHQSFYVDKNIFGSYDLIPMVGEYVHDYGSENVDIEIFGFCTDICVISNALMLKSAFPNVHMSVNANCCAGVSPEKHAAALEVMRSCQIDVI